MDELIRLKQEKEALEYKIKELEINQKTKAYGGKCYHDKTDNVYYKILHVDQNNNADYIRVKLNDTVECLVVSDYDDTSTFTDYQDTVEISKEEFNAIFDLAVEKIKCL